MRILDERQGDAEAIRAVTAAAFEGAPHSSGSEAAIVEGLRKAGALALSLVAVEESGAIAGHAAFSAVSIAGEAGGWFGLGPVSVRPDVQRRGIGAALIRAGLERLREMGAEGCVVLGDPAYYSRLGFESDPALRYGEVPAEYFRSIRFGPARPRGEVRYHRAFEEA
jgi:predicted N-acetyltransferase YhbS